jgi:hypothetical protein
MKVREVSDNQQAVDILRHVAPDWIEEMPIAVSAPSSSALISARSCYSGDGRQGVYAAYLGQGCDPKNRGWLVWIFDDIGEAEFSKRVVPQMDKEIAALLQESA